MSDERSAVRYSLSDIYNLYYSHKEDAEKWMEYKGNK
jgi:hypothetical protein